MVPPWIREDGPAMAPPPSRGGMGLEGATGDKIGSSRLLLSFQRGHARVNVPAVFGETWSEPRAGKKPVEATGGTAGSAGSLAECWSGRE